MCIRQFVCLHRICTRDEPIDEPPKTESKLVSLSSRALHASMATEIPLRVAVRIRPSLARDHGPVAASMTAAGALVVEDEAFAFSRCFTGTASQHEVYGACAAPQVEAVLAGYDACVIAYGQTGAGKTYSMIGLEGGRAAGRDGILPRAAAAIFRAISSLEAEADAQYRLSATFVEVHREGVFDLLSTRSKLKVRDSKEGAGVEGAASMRIRSTASLLKLVARGAAQRQTAQTGVHAHSSRSHALLALTLERRRRTGEATEGGHRVQCRTSTLRLVDLAGSEGLSAWGGAAGLSADGIATNLGLHVLGRCIAALAVKAEHVPFRDSLLTRLLQPALAGGCQTQLIACISPALEDAAESVRVLRYAQSAQTLVGHPQLSLSRDVDVDPMAGDVDDADEQLQRRCVWLHVAGFGEVFARVVGAASGPLVLYVHGSGPRNSSMVWNDCAVDAARLLGGGLSGGSAHYHVAIDCPGYGRSPGDRQTIRSYPGQFLSAVIRAAGHHRAAALVGSSQVMAIDCL